MRSLLARAASRAAETTVCCATRGEAGGSAAGVPPDPDDLARTREGELRAASRLLGVREVLLLGWQDSGMAGEPGERALVAAPLEEVAGALMEVIEESRPGVVVTLDASDGHRDHAHIRDATLLAVDRARWPVGSVYLSCLAQSLMRRWVERIRDEQPGSEHLDLGDLGTPDDLITTVIDTSAHYELRWEAIRTHASQTPPFAVMPEELQREFLAVDRLRRVRPTWPGGPREHDIADWGVRSHCQTPSLQ